MKIAEVEAIELRLQESEIVDKASGDQNSLIVEVPADEGIVGIGKVDLCPRVARAVVEDPFIHTLVSGPGRIPIGMNPFG